MSPAPSRSPTPTTSAGGPIADNQNSVSPQCAAVVRAGFEERGVAFSASS